MAERVGFAPRATSGTGVGRSLEADPKRHTSEQRERCVAERVGFEPTCRLPDNTLSRRARYDHFGTSPQRMERVDGTLKYPPARAPPRSPRMAPPAATSA